MKDDSISRQAAIDAICKACSMDEDYHKCDGYPETSTWCDELVALRSLPSADVQPVVRCKDCVYWSSKETMYCNMLQGTFRENDYCSYAERIFWTDRSKARMTKRYECYNKD